MKITFYGAVDGVTGSKYLLESDDQKILIECGLFQGNDIEERKNWENFPFDPHELDTVIVTHSHIDHIGLLPKLVKDGFDKKIYSTDATRDFCNIFLPDSCNILNKDLSKDQMIYSVEDVNKTINLFEPLTYHHKVNIGKNIYLTFFDAGHILGSAIVKIEVDGKIIIFSGDLGNPPVPIIKDTEFIEDANYVVLESTYGDRTHKLHHERKSELEKSIEDAYTKNGTILIPAFAMERTQELLYELQDLILNNRIPKIPIYIDSPLAIKATNIYPKYIKYFDSEAKKTIKNKDHLFDFPNLKIINNVAESKQIDYDNNPKIIIAGSGMSTGGRILFHEKAFLPNPSTTLLIVGYQVDGTVGRQLQDGAKTVNILNQKVNVRAEIRTLNSYSAHADQPKLLHWLKQNKKISHVFLVHGEDNAKKTLKSKIQDQLGYQTSIPKLGESFIL
jgi:metallo-beta-lactamase family protein